MIRKAVWYAGCSAIAGRNHRETSCASQAVTELQTLSESFDVTEKALHGKLQSIQSVLTSRTRCWSFSPHQGDVSTG
eukprot:m.452304 g.452304  ORF g.452304 m.452304 type:complete len:77 (-) comp20303_c0_seq1:214-444(-)